jgi:hypothetical protein
LARLYAEQAAVLPRGGNAEEAALGRRRREQAETLARDLGQTGLLRMLEIESSTPSAVDPARASFSLVCDGEYWTASFGGKQARVRANRGLRMLAELTSNPDIELHVLRLSGGVADAVDTGDAGPALDAEATSSYRRRLEDLRDELEEAEDVWPSSTSRSGSPWLVGCSGARRGRLSAAR